MKPFIEKPVLTEEISFLARTYRTPHFEIPWHQHVEYELILFTEGEGLIFMGNYVGDFRPGDIFFIGSNLPHTFQKASKDMIVNAVVIQFTEYFWGQDFLLLPESKSIRKLLDKSANGIRLNAVYGKLIEVLMQEILTATGFDRIISLCKCLQKIAVHVSSDEQLSTHSIKEFHQKNKERIDKVFQYTIENFQDTVTLDMIAQYAGMSTPAFCNYFKKCAKKPYITFLNEIRIGYAASLIIDTNKSIESICYESGYNTIANFNKQFQKIKKITPSAFRKTFRNSL